MSDNPDTNNAHLHPYGSGSHAVLANEREMPACYPVKGNIRPDGTRLYHRPDSRNYSATKPEIWFDSPSAAEAAGFRLSPTHPEGATGAPFEPGGSSHPCTAGTVEANRVTARGGTALHPYGPGSHAMLADGREMPACYPIKGNIRPDGTRLYHRPDSRNYGATKPEIWFDSPSAAEAVGFELSPTHGDGSSGVSYEPGGSNHPCSAETVEANRAGARAAVAEALGLPLTLVGVGAGARADGSAGEDGLMIEPGRSAHDTALHPHGVGSRAALADPRAMPDGYPIKGNVRRDGSRRYHRPDSTAYASTHAEAWFDSPAAAEAADFSLAASHPEGVDVARFEPGGDGHGWSRAHVGAARYAALHGPAGAPGAGTGATAAGSAADDPAGTVGGTATAGLGLAALAGAVTLGAAGFDPDLHPYGIGSHRLLGNAIEMPDLHPVKGNVRNDGSRLYHRPDSRSYSVTKPEVWFDSPSAAEAAGFSLSPTHPDGADPADWEPGGAGHPWSWDEVHLARLRFLHGPDADLDATVEVPSGYRTGTGTDTGGSSAGLAAGAVVAGAAALAGGAALLGGGADDVAAGVGAAIDAGKSDIEKLATGTFELTGPRAGATIPDAGATADTASAGVVDPNATVEVPAGFVADAVSGARAADDSHDDSDDDQGAGIGTVAAVTAGVAGVGLAGAALSELLDGDDDAAAGAETTRPAHRPPVGRDQRTAAGPRPESGEAGPKELVGAGALAGTGTGTVTGQAATVVNAGRTTMGATAGRRLGPWAWIAGAAGLLLLLGVILSQCGGASTNEAIGGSTSGSGAASTTAKVSGSTEEELAGPSASATGGSTTATAASSTGTPSTTAAPTTTATTAAASDNDLQIRALAALSAAGFKNVQVEINAGKVRILGNVASTADSTKAEQSLAGISGLSGVENALVVAETPSASAVQGDPDYTG